MNKVLVPLAILLGAALGAGGFLLAGSTAEPQQHPPAAGLEKRLARIEGVLGGVQARLAEVERRKGFEEVMADEKLRAQLAAIVTETGAPDPKRPPRPRPGSEAWRKTMAGRFREGYRRILASMRKSIKATDAEWKKLGPQLTRHFAPVEAALKEMEAGKTSRPPAVNRLSAPVLAETLKSLKAGMRPDQYRAFDAWRREPANAMVWGPSPGDYFLSGEEYKDFRVRRAVEMHWISMQKYMRPLNKELRLGKEKQAKLDSTLRDHLKRVLGVFRNEDRPNLRDAKFVPRIKVHARATESAIRTLLGEETAQAFGKWVTAPGNRASHYFGQPYRKPTSGPAHRKGTKTRPPRGVKRF